MGGRRLEATGRCLFAMLVSEKITYNEYWGGAAYADKKPVRNGSSRMLVGDNIYYLNPESGNWQQADSHHSNVDGSVNSKNQSADTKSDKVLISRCFWYFGIDAPLVPASVLAAIGFQNRVGHRVYDYSKCVGLIAWLHNSFSSTRNTVQADPYDFDMSGRRYSGHGSKIT
jgi:hypothetical protein